MAVVATWDGANRRIYLASGVTEAHPIDDIYREYRTARANDETFRVWEPFMVAIGHDPKGGGRFTSRYLLLLDDDDIGQVKIIPFDEGATLQITGEVLAQDQTDPFDISTLTNAMVIRYTPPDTEIIEKGTSGLTAGETIQLDEIHGWSYLAHVWSKIALFGAKITKRSTDPENLPGTMEVYDPDTDLLVVSGDIYEDEAKVTGYRGRGIDHQEKLS
jgi:hypothetical protein